MKVLWLQLFIDAIIWSCNFITFWIQSTRLVHRLTSLRAQPGNIIWVMLTGNQQLLAIGDSYGTLHVLEVPWVFRQSSAKEPQLVMGYLMREKDRLEYMEMRREGRVGEKRERDAKIAHQKQVLDPTMEKSLWTVLAINREKPTISFA